MNEILLDWQSEDIRRRHPALPVWDIAWPGLFSRRRRRRREAVAACRKEVRRTLLEGSRPVFLMPNDSPKENEVPGHWEPAGEATWLVPPEFDPDEPRTMRWLSLGDWRLYTALKRTRGNSPDVFRCRAADLLAWMSANGVRVLVESFHDDTAWVVAAGATDASAGPDHSGPVDLRR